MFNDKAKNQKLWIMIIILVALVAITLLLQAQILVMLQDLQTYFFQSYEWVMDSNPMPPMKPVMDSNPLPI